MSPAQQNSDELRQEILDLEQKLQDAQAQLLRLEVARCSPPTNQQPSAGNSTEYFSVKQSLHNLLLLADSALPLGSFAFSSGLESYLAHRRQPAGQQCSQFDVFLRQSLASLASTSLPYVLAAYREPARIEEWDDEFDASLPCTVARRASVTQGRALIAVWERSFKRVVRSQTDKQCEAKVKAVDALNTFSKCLRRATGSVGAGSRLNAHLAPLWGGITYVLGMDQQNAAYVFLFSHARAVVGAAVRANVLGPYQAQAELASPELRQLLNELVVEWWDKEPEEAGQVVPVMDIWVGRHEKLYSRIFNS